jgi:FlaG/FlaF family flagellin (archaellin)
MKGISTILATILIVIIVVALVSLTYTFAVGLFSTASHGATTGTTEVTTRLGKTVTFAASSCIGPTNDVVKFTLQHTGTVDIIAGDMATFLDGSPATFTNSTGTTITNIGLTAGKFSTEFNYTATGHKASRIITVATPAGSMDQPITCSSS